ncbi:hypothetical protein BC941DRAFT_470552 [Chlamydoabsidia padenii]|nr:hypothetical protein BC941DRAFT_470552 [Chlamydoabsidia padenii]
MSTKKHPINIAEQSPYRSRHGRTTEYSLSRSSFSDTASYVPPPPPPPDALTTSPSLSLSSFSTRRSTDKPRSSRHYYSSSLGRPPGQHNVQTTTPVATPAPIASSSFPLASSAKTIPVKEIQKLVTDLKKENFDLKLRLYHTEQQLEKDKDKCRLEEENDRLRMELELQKERMEYLEQVILENHHHQTQSCDASTQTTSSKNDMTTTKSMTHKLRITTPAEPITLTSSSSLSSSSLSPTTSNSNSYFPSDPASFGLTSSSSSLARQNHPSHNKVEIANIVDQFQNVKLHSPRSRQYKQPSPNHDHHGRVSGWLERIIFPPVVPDQLTLSPTSVPSTSSFHSPLEYTTPIDSYSNHHQ